MSTIGSRYRRIGGSCPPRCPLISTTLPCGRITYVNLTQHSAQPYAPASNMASPSPSEKRTFGMSILPPSSSSSSEVAKVLGDFRTGTPAERGSPELSTFRMESPTWLLDESMQSEGSTDEDDSQEFGISPPRETRLSAFGMDIPLSGSDSGKEGSDADEMLSGVSCKSPLSHSHI